MKPTKTPSETLELACRLAEMMRKRADKIVRLSTLAGSSIENGEIAMSCSPLLLLSCEAEGLMVDVRQIGELLGRLPEPDQGGRNG